MKDLDEYLEQMLFNQQSKISDTYIEAKLYEDTCKELDKGREHE